MIFIIKGQLEKNVPIISQIMISIDKGLKTSVICTSCNNLLLTQLKEKGINIYCTKHKTIGSSFVKKVSDWLLFKKNALKILKRIYISDESLYIGSVDTVLSLGQEIYKYDYILHIRELYDKNPLYLNFMKKYANHAKVTVVPEYCRANILNVWLELNKKPIVIPNKPFGHMRIKNLKITDDNAATKIKKLQNKKIILYQGHIGDDRNLHEIAQALKIINNDEYVIVLMGTQHTDVYVQLKTIYPNIIHIDYVPAPFHLQITSHAHIGIVNYDDSSLNNMFCAPNKIYEYSGFGIPTLGRDIPGLRYSIGYNNAGVCVDFDEIENLVKGIKEIEDHYDFYSKKAKDFFDSTDLIKLFDKIIE